MFAPGRFLPDQILSNATNVKLFQLWSSGFDKFNIKGAQRYNIPVANNGGANAISVAEHTVCLMLAIFKWLPDSHRRTVSGQWAGNSHGTDMFLLHEKHLGLIVFGKIGREVAKRCRAFGMSVSYFDTNRADKETEVALDAKYLPFDELLTKSDIVSLHLHANKETIGIIGKKQLAQMKSKAVLINVSRAELVDTQELLYALKLDRLWGAGLDVYDTEPTRPNDPLLTHSRVVATPHMAGSTMDAYQSAMTNAWNNFERVRKGKKPLWIVNKVR